MIEYLRDYFPQALHWYNVFKLSFSQRKLIPNNAQLKYSGNRLFANPYEPRGNTLLRNQGTGQPFVKKFWRLSVKTFRPELLIDIGANYGEILFDINYPEEVLQIIGIEANPKLYPFLKRSKSEHPDKQKISIFSCIASDFESDEVLFYVDRTSSGRSTPLINNFVRKTKVVKVQSSRVDKLVDRFDLIPSCIIFKIDVEGFEPFVLKGMNGLLNSKIDLIGCVEFNLESFHKNKIDVSDYLNYLNKYFVFLIPDQSGALVESDRLSIDLLKNLLNRSNIEGDILLFTDPMQLKVFKSKFTKLD